MKRLPTMTLAVMSVLVVWAGVAGESAQAAPCPEPDREPGYVNISAADLIFPDRLAYGREGAVEVAFSVSPNDHVEAGHLEYVDAYGRVLFDHTFTSEELSSDKNSFPVRVTRATGSVLIRLSFREYAAWYEPYCDFAVEETVEAVPGVAPRLVGEFNEHGWRGDAESAAFLVKPDYCETIALGRLHVVFRHHGRKRVLDGGPACSSPWTQQGQLMPGLRLRSDDPGSVDWSYLPFIGVGKRNWTRTYRIDASWNGTPIARRWLRVFHRIRPAHRIYADRDEEGFYLICEGGSDDTGDEGLPIREDPQRGSYCVVPQTPCSEGHVLVDKPGSGGALPRPNLCA